MFILVEALTGYSDESMRFATKIEAQNAMISGVEYILRYED